MGRDVVEVGSLFEGNSPLARRLEAEGPYASPAELVAAARRVAGRLSVSERIETLAAHPRIGECAERLSPASLAEQGAGGDPRVLAELERLNAAYEQRFGFRFVIVAGGRPKSEILEVLRVRIDNDRDRELETGITAVVDIAEQRLARA